MLLPSSDRPFASPADLAACRSLLRGGSRSFHAAAMLLPWKVRDPAVALYAFCRIADDAVDCDANRDAIETLSQRLDLCYAGRPLPHPADRALADVLRQFAIPRVLPEALLEGFAWDAAGRRYETLDDVTEYAVRVAGTVGAMMSVLMGAREPDMVTRACQLGVAMQFSNIARDVGEDARAGRLYLPRQWLCEAGIEPDCWLAVPSFSPALGGVVRRLLRHAETLYAGADSGIARLPRACRLGIAAARRLYAEIGHQVERNGCDPVTTRAVVPPLRKARVLVGKVSKSAADLSAGSLPHAAFLVDAVAASSPWPPPHRPARRLEDRLSWMIGLFDRIDARAG